MTGSSSLAAVAAMTSAPGAGASTSAVASSSSDTTGRNVPHKQRSGDSSIHGRKPSSGTTPHYPAHSAVTLRPPVRERPAPGGVDKPTELLINSLVQKALAKVAARTENHLPPAEMEEVVRQSCGSLLQMCRSSLSYVVFRLLQELGAQGSMVVRPAFHFSSCQPS